jgi:hypothetical protein
VEVGKILVHQNETKAGETIVRRNGMKAGDWRAKFDRPSIKMWGQEIVVKFLVFAIYLRFGYCNLTFLILRDLNSGLANIPIICIQTNKLS